MKSVTAFTATAALALVASVTASPAAAQNKVKRSITPVTTNGNAFFAGSERFFVRGVDYQPGGASVPVDPIADFTTCQRDIVEFKKLGLNTVRVYTVDNTANHDDCMNALADAGIYLALDVNSGLYSINRADPAPSYNNVYLQNVFATIDAFANYDNTLLFFSGNEVINNVTNTNAAPYVKAVTRDMKAYIAARAYRNIPVGYSAADVSQNRYQMAAYMNCGPASVRSDFFAFNDYSWCDPSSFTTSGWSAEVALYSNYSIPLFLSEYGCNKNPPREFEEVGALYNAEMTAVYSGGLVYEYSEESDNPGFGLVTIDSTTKVTELTDFNNLMSQFQQNPNPTSDSGYKTNLSPLACPSPDQYWDVQNDDLPAMPVGAEQYLKNGAGKGVGLTGPGSQTAGTASSGFTTPASGSSTVVYGTASTGAAASLRAPEFQMGPIYSLLAVFVSTLIGAGLVL